MSHYRAGADFERAVRLDLIDNGYDVIRSAGSKTKVDLVAFKPGQALFVQCKRDGRIGPAERTELLRVAGHVDGLAVVAWKVSGKSAVLFRRLLGTDPGDYEAWTPDSVVAS